MVYHGAKESQLLDIGKGFGEQVAVLGAELRAVQAESADLASQCSGACGGVNTLTAEREAGIAREVTVIGNQQAAEVAREALSRDANTARR